MSLVIDTAAANRVVPEDEFGQWAQSQSVFLSSVMGELAVERRSVAAALDDSGFVVRWFEGFGGRDDPPDAAYLTEVAGADIYVGLIRDDYGAMQRTGFSATHEEYLEARSRGKRVSFWVATDGANRAGHARRFVDDVQVFNVTGSFTDASDLVAGLRKRLKEMAAEDLSPWVKVGDAVFRAEEIHETGARLVVRARVRDARVMAALRGVAPGQQWGGGQEVPVAYSDRAEVGRVETIEVQTQSQAVQVATLTMNVAWAEGRDSTAMGVQGLAHGDVVEAGIRAGYLHEPLPPELASFGMGSFADTTDGLAPLISQRVTEGSVAAIARLLAVEHLVGTRRVAMVEDFVLGPRAGRDQTRFGGSWPAKVGSLRGPALARTAKPTAGLEPATRSFARRLQVRISVTLGLVALLGPNRANQALQASAPVSVVDLGGTLRWSPGRHVSGGLRRARISFGASELSLEIGEGID